MSEETKPNVNKLHKGLARAGRNAWNARPKKTRGANGWEQAGNITGNVAMTGASGLTWGAWLVSWLATKLLADNPVLDKFEKEFSKIPTGKKTRTVPLEGGGTLTSVVRDDNKFLNFLKKNPRLASYISYYLLLAATVTTGGAYLSGRGGDKDKDNDSQDNKIEVVANNDAAPVAPTATPATPADESAVNFSDYTGVTVPQASDFVSAITQGMDYDMPADISMPLKEMVGEYWPVMGLGVTELETYYERPHKNPGEPRATNGPGVTWNYSYVNGKLVQRANIPGRTPTLSRDENYEQSRFHLEFETFPALRRAIKGKKNIVKRHVVGVALAGYQGIAAIPGIMNKIENATNAQQVADAFKAPPNLKTAQGLDIWVGTMKRRWWCAAIACGIISPEDFLDMPRDAFSRLELNTLYNGRTGHFKLDPATVEYALSRVSSKSTCRQFLSEFATGRHILAGLNKAPRGKVVDSSLEQSVTQKESAAVKFLTKGDAAYRKKKYADAVSLYKQAIDTDADNMQAYSSLALAYKKLGDENKSIDYYQKCCDIVKQGNSHMNKNRSLLYDPDAKAATYYNAGLAREAMADLQMAAGNKKDAKKNYDLARKNFETAIYNVNRGDGSQSRLDTYGAANERVQKKQKDNKFISFNAADTKLKKKSVAIDKARMAAMDDMAKA